MYSNEWLDFRFQQCMYFTRHPSLSILVLMELFVNEQDPFLLTSSSVWLKLLAYFINLRVRRCNFKDDGGGGTTNKCWWKRILAPLSSHGRIPLHAV